MPKFSPDALARIGRAARRVERQPRNPRGHRARWQGTPRSRDRWYRLSANLDAGGTATAILQVWDATADGGDGDYADEAAATPATLRDTVAQHWGLIGERIRVTTRAASNATVYEVLGSGAPWWLATLADTLTYRSSAAATVTVRGVSVTVTVHDKFLVSGTVLPIDAEIGIAYDLENARWVATEASCGSLSC